MVEHFLGKEEVTGSIPVVGTIFMAKVFIVDLNVVSVKEMK